MRRSRRKELFPFSVGNNPTQLLTGQVRRRETNPRPLISIRGHESYLELPLYIGPQMAWVTMGIKPTLTMCQGVAMYATAFQYW